MQREGWLNLRDLGGLPAAHGRTLRPRRLLRSENPELSAKQIVDAVRDLTLARVVDLRSRAEVDASCTAWDDHGVRYHRIPLSAGPADSWHARYTSYLENRPANVVDAVRAIAGVDHGPHDRSGGAVLVHCAAGKDRTGVVIAVVLSLLGVPDEEIVADYVLTAPAVEAILRRLEAAGQFGVVASPEFVADQQPLAATMEGFLAWLAERGGAEAWLLAEGLEPERINALRARLLT